ncbi:MAG: hypothetical protein RMJ36_05920 [Candidatus Calescibacterium sp.]|nr:hypothetical protein [Candidatus Calescibacterium sp.]MDW8133173.1 hypothetical protein [Candidatus Calescibacterium sp.]
MIKDKIQNIKIIETTENKKKEENNEYKISIDISFDLIKKSDEFQKNNTKNFLTKSTQASLEKIKIFLDTYITVITTSGLFSIFLPHPIAALIGAVAGITHLLTKEKSITKKITEKIKKYVSPIAQKIGKTHTLIPFKYPTIIGDKLKYQEIVSTLDQLPLKTVNNLSIIEINNELNDKYEAIGLVIDKIYNTPIYLYSNPYPYTLKEVLVHEIGHTVDLGFKIFPTNYKSSLFFIPKYPWGIKNFVSSYAATNSREDFAESFAKFYLDSQKLKETSAYKYEYIKNIQQQNFLEKLVDNKFLRNIGKKLSEFMSKFPVIRHILDVGSFYASHKTISEGIEKILQANQENNQNKAIDSKFTLLSGLLMARKSIYSLPLIILNLFVSKILKNEKMKNSSKYSQILNFIEKSLNISLAFTIGPIGTSIYQSLQTNSNKKNKAIVLLSGLTTTLLFYTIKLSFPTFIPLINIVQNLSVIGITELIKRKLSN